MVGLEHQHVVDVYEQDADLARRAADYLADGLARGEAALVLATPEHRAGITARLAGRGIDVAGCRANGQLYETDAEGLLRGFFADGSLDAERFGRTVGGLVRAASSFPGIRVVGELVDILWARGDVVGAVALEAEWNALAERLPFSLYCGYRSDTVGGDADGLARLQELHGAVVSAPPAIGWMACRTAERFPAALTSPRAARQFVADALAAWGLGDRTDVASLVASELATNAVLHAATPFEVVLSRRPTTLRIVVRDESPVEPAMREAAAAEANGRGLGIVATLAHDWGFASGRRGKTVWVDLAVAPR